MNRRIIMWFRNDLRIHDNPALTAAATYGSEVIPLFILDEELFHGDRSSPNRNRFLHESLYALRQSLQQSGSNLVIRIGHPQDILADLSASFRVSDIYYTGDYTPYALKRDHGVASSLARIGISSRPFSGRATVENLSHLKTKTGNIYKVFTPFYKQWLSSARRPISQPPAIPPLPAGLDPGPVPAEIGDPSPKLLSPRVVIGGERTARERLSSFLQEKVHHYSQSQNDMGSDATSRLSPYLHFGCLSTAEIEYRLPDNDDARAFQRQLAWRDFYMYILFHFPQTTHESFQERYRGIAWQDDQTALSAWKNGQTGYPIIDAAMRQLLTEGWMHNRARLIVGSFLTKDLGIDWLEGEKHFMHWLLDGDTAQNVGNWQWIASIGVDPAPLFRRLYNPVSQQKTYDPEGAYVRRYVPELQHVPLKYLAEPWKMNLKEQQTARCVVGQDYPEPIINHAAARAAALERYQV